MDILSNILAKLSEIHPLLGLAGICACIFAPIVLLAVLTHRFVQGQKKSNEPEQRETAQEEHGKQLPFYYDRPLKIRIRNWVFVIFIACAVQAICLWLFYTIVPRAGTRIEQYARRYDAASVMQPKQMCSYKLVRNSDVVLELHKFSSAPVPDAASGYSFFLQVKPDLLKEGQEFTIPDTGVSPFLWRLIAPGCETTEDVQGRLRVLQVTNTTMETWLEIHSLTLSPTWQYEGEVKFESATIPPY